MRNEAEVQRIVLQEFAKRGRKLTRPLPLQSRRLMRRALFRGRPNRAETQRELCERCGLHQRTLTRWLGGYGVRLAFLHKLADATGIEFDMILEVY